MVVVEFGLGQMKVEDGCSDAAWLGREGRGWGGWAVVNSGISSHHTPSLLFCCV